MRAVKIFGVRDLRVVEMENPPAPGPGEVLVQVKAVGVCASDVHYYNEGRIGDAVVTEPLVIGHEFAGIIADVGPGVTNVEPGDRVAVEPGIHCGTCDMCEEGYFNLCRNIRFCGTPPHDGSMRDFMVWPAHLVEKVPDSMTMGEAAMLEPLAVGVYAVEIADDVAGKTVGVLGSGAIGLSILQAAKAAGCAETIVTDPLPFRLGLAKKLGADHTLDASDPDLVAKVKEMTGGRGLDLVFEAAGENDAVRQATEMVRPAGTVVIGGIPSEDSMTITASVVRRKQVRMQMLRRSNNCLKRSIDLVESGKIALTPFITHTFPVEHAEEAFLMARDHKDQSLRVVVEMVNG